MDVRLLDELTNGGTEMRSRLTYCATRDGITITTARASSVQDAADISARKIYGYGKGIEAMRVDGERGQRGRFQAIAQEKILSGYYYHHIGEPFTVG